MIVSGRRNLRLALALLVFFAVPIISSTATVEIAPRTRLRMRAVKSGWMAQPKSFMAAMVCWLEIFAN